MIEDIQKNSMIPNQFKPLLINAIDIPERVLQLERIIVKLQPLVQVSEQIARQQGLPPSSNHPQQTGAGVSTSSPAPQNPHYPIPQGEQQGGGGMSQFLQMAQMFGGGGGDSQAQFFEQMGRQAFLESFSFNRMIQRRVLRSMGSDVIKDFDLMTKKLADVTKTPLLSESIESGT